MRRIAETIRVLLFMTLSILVFNFYPVTAVMIVLLPIFNDGAILSIAYDRVQYANRPESFVAKDSSLAPEQIEKATRHLMDCIDCHDRPIHVFTPPDRSMDDSLLAGRIDRSLPFIKQQGVSALTKSYNTTDKALRGIAQAKQQFYSTKYADVGARQRTSIQAAIADLQHIYQSTIFPYMKVDWRTHPNNIGHIYTPGCFRCHDGQHFSTDGKVIPKDCNTCHTVLAQLESGTRLIRHEEGIPLEHPVDLGNLTQVTCSDYHTGGMGP